MPITTQCPCGRSLKLKEELSGRKIRCPECNTVVEVPTILEEADEPEEVDVHIIESPPKVTLKQPKSKRAPIDSEEGEFGIQPTPKALRRPASFDRRRDEPTRRSKNRTRKHKESGWGVAVHPQIATGVGLIAAAFVVFFVGLLFGRIFLYSPILVILGIIAIVKGFMGRD